MTNGELPTFSADHGHVFLGEGHEKNERKTWAVIWLCTFMMIAEIVGGSLFGSLALVADGLHMSTHAGALLLAALAYGYARRHADDPRFAFGTGKIGDLAGFSSANILFMIALLIAYEAVVRMLHPVAIDFAEAIPIACIGLLVNIASAWLLSGGDHAHDHGHHHRHASDTGHHEDNVEAHRFDLGAAGLGLEIFEDGVPPRFRARFPGGPLPDPRSLTVTTVRADGSRQTFTFEDRGEFLESRDEIPEPHAFAAHVDLKTAEQAHFVHSLSFEDHDRAHHHGIARDNNLRAAFVHIMADAAVSVMVIVGLLLARFFGWLWMDPLAGLIGAVVIATWSYRLIRDTGAILLDRIPDPRMAENVRRTIENDGDRLSDLHLWRLGPGHLGAIVSIRTERQRGPAYYHQKLSRFSALSHITVEVHVG